MEKHQETANEPVFKVLRSNYEMDDDNMHTMEIQCRKFKAKLFYMGNYMKDRDEGKLNISLVTFVPTAIKPMRLKPFVAYDGICVETDIDKYKASEMDRVLEVMSEDLELVKEFEKFFLETFPGIYGTQQ